MKLSEREPPFPLNVIAVLGVVAAAFVVLFGVAVVWVARGMPEEK